MIKIALNKNKGFSWYSNEGIFIKGYFFDNENNFYKKDKMLSFFVNVKTKNDFINKLKNINGVFSVILKIKDNIFMASGIARMFPLFYSFNNNSIVISDDIVFLKQNKANNFIDKQAATDFLLTGYTINKKTLIKDVYQLEANHYIFFNSNKKVEENYYFNYLTKKESNLQYNTLKNNGIKIFEDAFSRCIKSVGNKHIAVPLSGGYDSRLIAFMLKKNGIENVTCYTYGRKGNSEIKYSKKVAKVLGYRWVFIEYNNDLIKGYINSNIFKEYSHFTGNFSSMPMLQEYFAVKYLHENKIIPQDTIFIPGHSGDFIGGSHLKDYMKNINITDTAKTIYKKHFKFNKTTSKDRTYILNNIKQQIKNKNAYNYSIIENWNLQERQAKFINNSSSVYNYFGYEHRFPFWDKELVLFFKNIPFRYKLNKYLYDDILKIYFKKYKLDFEINNEQIKQSLVKQIVKKIIKPFLPNIVKQNLLQKKDWIFYKEITDQMVEQLKEKNIKYNKNINSYNSIIIQWYMNIVRESIN